MREVQTGGARPKTICSAVFSLYCSSSSYRYSGLLGSPLLGPSIACFERSWQLRRISGSFSIIRATSTWGRNRTEHRT